MLSLRLCFSSGCAGKIEYTPPAKSTKPIENSKTINKPKELVWNSAIAELSKQFFVINNMDKASGFMNIGFSGDSEKYLDCGNIYSYVKNARGERVYNFPTSRASQVYEVLNNELYVVNRKMSMKGRINIIFEEIAKNQTRVTANIKYIVAKEINESSFNPYNPYPRVSKDTIYFNTNQVESFLGAVNSTKCLSNGELERTILD